MKARCEVAVPKDRLNQQDAAPAPSGKAAKRAYVKATDVPSCGIREAMRVPRAISDEYGKAPTPPLDVAAALRLQPSSRPFRVAARAALAFGLTDGGPAADVIGLTELGLRAVAPTEEGDDVEALREGFQRPRVIHEFLKKYDNSPLPSEEIGRNVLERIGVAGDATARVFDLIVQGAGDLGLLREINGKQYVHLRAARLRAVAQPEADDAEDREPQVDEPLPSADVAVAGGLPSADDYLADLEEHFRLPVPEHEPENRRVFISHGSNKAIVNRLSELLIFGEFEPVVSVKKESTARPVPEKVLGEMRSCGAGIVHVGTERVVVDSDGNEHHLLNENVLIEIGIAMASWGKNYILLVEEGTQLPSNLQGLYEVRYRGDDLDADATMKLLRAFKEFKEP